MDLPSEADRKLVVAGPDALDTAVCPDCGTEFGYPTHPTTGENWEGVGVIPDIPASSELALKVAHKMALESVIEMLDRPSTEPLRMLLAEAQEAYEELNDE